MELPEDLADVLGGLDEWAAAACEWPQPPPPPQFPQQAVEFVDSPRSFWEREEELAALGLGGGADPESAEREEPAQVALAARLDACESLLAVVEAALGDLDRIEAQHRLVSDKTHTLHDMCKRLLAEQTRLDKVVSGIELPMHYFQALEEVAPRMGYDVVESTALGGATGKGKRDSQRVLHPDDEQFRKDLVRLDECVHFLEQHPHYHDQALYLHKLHLLQTHCMGMIKNWVVEEISRMVDSVAVHAKLKRSGSGASAADPQQPVNVLSLENSHLFHRFAEKGKVLRPSIHEMEIRPQVSFPALKEALTQLCAYRVRLLKDLVANSPEIRMSAGGGGAATSSGMGQTAVLTPGTTTDASSASNSLVRRVLVGSEFLARVCAAEHTLVSCFFSLPAMRQIFAAHRKSARVMRQRRSRQPDANSSGNSTGAQRVLNRYGTREDPGRNGRGTNNEDDYDGGGYDDEDEDDGGNGNGLAPDTNPFFDAMESLCTCLYDELRPLLVKENDLERLCDVASAIESAVQDLESRMDRDAAEPLQRVLINITFDVQERLVFCAARIIRDQVAGYTPTEDVLKRHAEGMVVAGAGGGGGGGTGDITTYGWYPTLEMTLDKVLSKVYRAVEPFVFEQLAVEAVSSCTKSLCDASRRIARRTGPDEGDLFLIKHLLILREQISPFRSALSAKETHLDFGSTSRALRQLFTVKRGEVMNLLRFAGPTAREADVDTKRALDVELKRASELYILRVTKRCLGPLLEFVDASQAYMQQESATWAGLASQDFASQKSVAEAVAFCEANTLKHIEQAKEKATRYIANPQTRSVLFNAVETNCFRVLNAAANNNVVLEFKDEGELQQRLRELVRSVGSLRTPVAPLNSSSSPRTSALSSPSSPSAVA